jgi:3-phenylpropionate/trans-cinnamate dioxygenase ferredoxin reductase subunit
VLVGAGYIGLEVAAVARARGHDVTVLEAAGRVMARVVSAPVSDFYEREHRDAGVRIHLNANVRAFHGEGRVRSVESASGKRFACDVVVVGIGIVPNVELARAAGIACGDSVLVDSCTRTSDERVLAAGDCTEHPLYGRRVRLESVANAIQQGKCAAACIHGTPTPYAEVPWFWSDQYDLKLQIAGLPGEHERVVVRGDPAARSFAAYYVTADRVVAVEAVNSPRDFLAARKLIGSAAPVDVDELLKPGADLGPRAR